MMCLRARVDQHFAWNLHFVARRQSAVDCFDSRPPNTLEAIDRLGLEPTTGLRVASRLTAWRSAAAWDRLLLPCEPRRSAGFGGRLRCRCGRDCRALASAAGSEKLGSFSHHHLWAHQNPQTVGDPARRQISRGVQFFPGFSTLAKGLRLHHSEHWKEVVRASLCIIE